MSQYQPNAAPGRSFIEKINSKFSSLSVSATIHHSDKDGSSEDDTLIHKAFVKFFEEKGQPFPEWLGVKENTRSSRHNKSASARTSDTFVASNSNSQFQPVRASYNSVNSAPNFNSAPTSATHSRQNSVPDTDGEERPYTRRTNSKLQALYHKSRQQSLPGSGYSSSSHSQYSPASPPPASRSNSSGQTLRDRVMIGSTYADPSSRPTWGK